MPTYYVVYSLPVMAMLMKPGERTGIGCSLRFHNDTVIIPYTNATHVILFPCNGNGLRWHIFGLGPNRQDPVKPRFLFHADQVLNESSHQPHGKSRGIEIVLGFGHLGGIHIVVGPSQTAKGDWSLRHVLGEGPVLLHLVDSIAIQGSKDGCKIESGAHIQLRVAALGVGPQEFPLVAHLEKSEIMFFGSALFTRWFGPHLIAQFE